ncbi:MAG: tyrosine-type recombinase/integrase [Cytophagales bacterium]|nr:tyrosine-type recombinase/integrase [Cytophagales bacterium]
MTNSFLKYLQYERRYSRHTITSYKNDLDQLSLFLKSNYPEVPVEQVNHAILRDWVVSLSEKGLNTNSINRKLVTLRSFFKFLLKKGVVEKSPVTKLGNLRTKKNLPQFVREKDMTLLLDHGKFDNNFAELRDYLVVEILYGTGIRQGELIELKINNIDLPNNSIKVFGKRNKERIIPIAQSLSTLISKYLSVRNDEFQGNSYGYLIVSNKGAKSYPMMINRIVKKYLAGISVDKKSPHVLRHTYATHLLDKGADLNAVKDLLGHQSLAATQVYTHNSLGKLKKAFDQAHPKA